MMTFPLLWKRLATIFSLAVLCVPVLIPAPAGAAETGVSETEVRTFISQLFQVRAAMLIDENPEPVSRFYLLGEKAGLSSFQLEIRRSRYINAWADKRGLDFTGAEAKVRITRLRFTGEGTANVSLIQSTRLTYRSKIRPASSQSFGVGTRHALFLKKSDGGWRVSKEWYLDPLDENPQLISDGVIDRGQSGQPEGPAAAVPDMGASGKKSGTRYDRDRAVAYAIRYAGAAWGSGNDQRYNRKYRDYTYLGGDCTNFASQVLGDPEEGGGLRMSGGWRYWFPGGGSHSWIQTDGFYTFLLYSGYGRLVAMGTFEQVTRPSARHPEGAIAKLEPGDLIAYEMDGDVDHFGIVVGFDDQGYPLVNSHTADRNRVPFDLGWDKHTRYAIIHING